MKFSWAFTLSHSYFFSTFKLFSFFSVFKINFPMNSRLWKQFLLCGNLNFEILQNIRSSILKFYSTTKSLSNLISRAWISENVYCHLQNISVFDILYQHFQRHLPHSHWKHLISCAANLNGIIFNFILIIREIVFYVLAIYIYTLRIWRIAFNIFFYSLSFGN